MIRKTSLRQIQPIAVALALLGVNALLAVTTPEARREEVVNSAGAEKLAYAPGKKIAAVTVNYAPGGKSGIQHYGGSLFAYVLKGAIRSENSATGLVEVYKAGESFFEPADSRDVATENASTTEPAAMLVAFIDTDGPQLTASDVEWRR
jgi:Uncharacterized conserved protein, contains double-stranded beta-helix domain